MLYTLNLYSSVCQLHINKIGGKKKKPWEWSLASCGLAKPPGDSEAG